MIKGMLVVLKGDVQNNLRGVITIFIPSRNIKKVKEYVNGNGDILTMVNYEVDITTLTDDERYIILDRMSYLQ